MTFAVCLSIDKQTKEMLRKQNYHPWFVFKVDTLSKQGTNYAYFTQITLLPKNGNNTFKKNILILIMNACLQGNNKYVKEKEVFFLTKPPCF